MPESAEETKIERLRMTEAEWRLDNRPATMFSIAVEGGAADEFVGETLGAGDGWREGADMIEMMKTRKDFSDQKGNDFMKTKLEEIVAYEMRWRKEVHRKQGYNASNKKKRCTKRWWGERRDLIFVNKRVNGGYEIGWLVHVKRCTFDEKDW